MIPILMYQIMDNIINMANLNLKSFNKLDYCILFFIISSFITNNNLLNTLVWNITGIIMTLIISLFYSFTQIFNINIKNIPIETYVINIYISSLLIYPLIMLIIFEINIYMIFNSIFYYYFVYKKILVYIDYYEYSKFRNSEIIKILEPFYKLNNFFNPILKKAD